MTPSSTTVSEKNGSNKVAEPCILVIFGATGDLTARKLMPALYNLAREGQLPSQFACVAFARRDKTNDSFRTEMLEDIQKYSREKPNDPVLWKTFSEKIFYHRSELDDEKGYHKLKEFLEELDKKLGTLGNRVFYFATQPSFFPIIVEKLAHNQLIYDIHKEKKKWSRIVVEKPFGHDLKSAQALQQHIVSFLDESQVYRIDHYLGKETVQNLLVFRFANSIFESLWNNHHIDHVQITVAEDLGVGTRGRFWEEAGMLRDIVQNHMMQLLSLVAMEPPTSLSADSIRDEKVKVLQSIRYPNANNLNLAVIRGQYDEGSINGEKVKSYRQEENVAPDSNVETYVALELFIDNWRWAGVPFYLRAGKRLPKRATEIAITFKKVPGYLLKPGSTPLNDNVLVIRIQPDEGIALRINCKVPGLNGPIQPVKMDFKYGSYFGAAPPEAYERLIIDCIMGDSTLFARDDEVMASWKLMTPILEGWAKSPPNFPNYHTGSWGPQEADQMLARDNRSWRTL